MSDAEWHRLMPIDEIADGGYVVATVAGQSVLVIRLGDEVFALENRCSHAYSALSGGRLRNGRLSCPLHGAQFDARNGAAIGGGLAPCGVRTFAVRLADGSIEVDPTPRPAVPR